MKKQKVVIVGGGFGGVKAALELCHDENFAVTLISDEDHFRYYPALYHTATGGAPQVSEIPLTELLDRYPITFVKARATRLNREAKQLVTKGAGSFEYDKLILALGMVTNFFGIEGLQEYSYGIKSLEEVNRLKNHIHQQLREDNRPDAHYLIVGGGPTGVELAGMLPTYLREVMEQHDIKHKAVHVELIEAMPKILPRMPKDVGRATAKRLRKLGITIKTNQKVESQTPEVLIINGKPVNTETVVWTAGVSCNPFFEDNKFVMTERRKAEVNEYLLAEPDIYVIGDNAGTLYGGVAQTALYDAIFVAKNLQRQARGDKPKVYKPKRPIYVTPTGPKWASVVYGKFRLYGLPGWWLRQAADLIAFHDYEPWWPASQRWFDFNDRHESCPTCAQAVQ